MYARVTVNHFSPYRLEEVVAIAREQTVPAARQQEGFKGFLFMIDRSTGKGITITFWEREANCSATGPNSAYYREAIAKVVPMLTAAPDVEDLEVVVQV